MNDLFMIDSILLRTRGVIESAIFLEMYFLIVKLNKTSPYFSK